MSGFWNGLAGRGDDRQTQERHSGCEGWDARDGESIGGVVRNKLDSHGVVSRCEALRRQHSTALER